MSSQAFLVGGLLFLAGLSLLLMAWKSGSVGLNPDSRAEALRTEKGRLQNEIRDLEYDFLTGKLSREDYEGGRRELVLETLSVMEALEGKGARQALEKDVEALILEARGRVRKGS